MQRRSQKSGNEGESEKRVAFLPALKIGRF